jgi:hypothetical protein
MIDRMKDRCRRICGDGETDCFVKSQSQLNCISDLVINKTASISMLLEFSLERDRKAVDGETAQAVYSSTNELSNWIKFLQMIGDMRQLHQLVLDSDQNEKRSEIRYPVPESMKGRVGLVFDGLPAGNAEAIDIINYSQSGVRFSMPDEIKVGSCIEALLVSDGGTSADLTQLSLEVRNNFVADGRLQVGAQVTVVSGREVFNFFAIVHSLLIGMELFDQL